MKIKVGGTMATNDDMTIDEVYKYLSKMRPKYIKANRTQKGQLLDEMVAITGRNRDYLSHILKKPLKRRPRRQQRTCTYQGDFDSAMDHLREL
jgi:hypothetical protein